MPFLLLRLVITTALALALGGCAQNPQTLQLDLTPPQPSARVSSGPAVALETVDRRENKNLGELENLDGPPAPLTTSQDVTYILKVAAGETLHSAGFRPQLWSDSASPRLLIEITQLRHTVSADLPRVINTRVTLTARAWRAGKRFSAQASSTRSARSATRPDAQRNAQDIEKALAGALHQLFDQRLVQFLAGRG